MPAKPLLIHIITRLEPGGSSRNVIDSCAAQVTDYDVVLLAGPHKDSGSLLKLLPPEVNYIEMKNLQREISPIRDFRALLELRKEIAALEPEIVHTHTSKAGALGRLAAAMANLRSKKRAVIIHTPHGHLLYGYYGPLKTFIFTLAEKFLSKFTDYFIALTPGEMRESAAAGIGKSRQWTVVHSGVDFKPPAAPGHKRDLDIAGDEIAVGTVARLEPVKGVEYFIRAAALLLKRLPTVKLKFVVIGGGELETKLRNLAGSLGIREFVLFTGFRTDAAAILPALDIYTQPSLNEAMGRAPLEAQAQGLPAVVTRVCGLPDIIKEGETGFSVEPGNADALAVALEKLILSADLRTKMGAAAKAWALGKDEAGFLKFGPESMNRQLKNFYAGIMAGRKY
ncbi:MAG: glycosyltransferase [Elusimicrobiota bacterium]|nr:glycosyltransferase [Elusimicrobiota bacterium]